MGGRIWNPPLRIVARPYANPGTKNRVQAMTTSAAVMTAAQRKSSLVNFNCFSRVRPSPPC